MRNTNININTEILGSNKFHNSGCWFSTALIRNAIILYEFWRMEASLTIYYFEIAFANYLQLIILKMQWIWHERWLSIIFLRDFDLFLEATGYTSYWLDTWIFRLSIFIGTLFHHFKNYAFYMNIPVNFSALQEF